LAEGGALARSTRENDRALSDPSDALAAILHDRRSMLRRYRRVLRTILAEVVRDEELMAIWKAELIVPGMRMMSETIAAIDGQHGIERGGGGLAASTRVFMTMLVGYILSGLVFERDDSVTMARAICDAMGWS
jgi:hypothetical protein